MLHLLCLASTANTRHLQGLSWGSSLSKLPSGHLPLERWRVISRPALGCFQNPGPEPFCVTEAATCCRSTMVELSVFSFHELVDIENCERHQKDFVFHLLRFQARLLSLSVMKTAWTPGGNTKAEVSCWQKSKQEIREKQHFKRLAMNTARHTSRRGELGHQELH